MNEGLKLHFPFSPTFQEGKALKVWKTLSLLLISALSLMLLPAFSKADNEQGGSVSELGTALFTIKTSPVKSEKKIDSKLLPPVLEFLPDIFGTPEKKVRIIADYIAKVSNGLLVVPHAIAAPHRMTRKGPEGKITVITHFGAHYNVFIIKRSDLLTDEDMEESLNFVGRLFQLTTEHIFAKEEGFTHIGVQVFPPNTWSFGGHKGKDILILTALTSDLIPLLEIQGMQPTHWLAALDGQTQKLYTESMIEILTHKAIESAQKKGPEREQKNSK